MLVPGFPWVRLALAGLALAAAAAAGWTVEHWRLTSKHEREAREAVESAQETERLGRMARDRSLDRAHTDLLAANRGAAVARATADQLRDAYIRFVTRNDSPGTAAVASGSDAAGPGLVPAFMLRGLGRDLAASLAEAGGAGADLVAALARARVANEQCQREHAIAVGISRREVKP